MQDEQDTKPEGIEAQPPKRGPGRPPKHREPDVSRETAPADDMAARRQKVLERRRKGKTGRTAQRLAVSEAALDRENWEYRWVNDRPGRVLHLQESDTWDIVRDPDRRVKADAEAGGSALTHVVGTDEHGQGQRGYLMRKPRQHYEEDAAAKQARIDERVRQIEGGDDRETAVDRPHRPGGEGIKIQNRR